MTLAANILRAKNAAFSRNKVATARGVFTSEDALHRAVAEYLNLAITPPDFWTTFPAGGGGPIRGAQLKARGLKPGVADILFLKAGEGRAYWIELKTKRGQLSDDQRQFAIDMRTAGIPWCVCRSVEEVEERLTEWNFTLRAHFRRQAA